MKTSIQFFLALLAVAVVAQSQATVVLPVSLQRMSATAELIFQGRVSNIEVKMDAVSNRAATFTTFAVSDVIKGNVGSSYTVKQVGGKLPGSNVEVRIYGVPKFKLGEEYVIFLPQKSRLGFASPIGLSQGAFDISEKNGERVVSNGRAINSLMTPRADRSVSPALPANSATQRAAIATSNSPLKAVAGAPAHTTLDVFKTTVRSMVAQ